MKYIRTKNNIYELEKAKELGIEGLAIGQSDSIYDLLDNLIIVTENHPHIYWGKRAFRVYGNDKLLIVFGAIWTSMGLIYVAKWKGKGAWKLLEQKNF